MSTKTGTWQGSWAPPSLPSVVGQGPTNRPKHIPTQNKSSDVGERACGKVVIGTRRPAVTSSHPLKRSGGKEPLVQGSTSDAERIIEALIGAGSVAIDGNGEIVNPQFSHGCLRLISNGTHKPGGILKYYRQ